MLVCKKSKFLILLTIIVQYRSTCLGMLNYFIWHSVITETFRLLSFAPHTGGWFWIQKFNNSIEITRLVFVLQVYNHPYPQILSFIVKIIPFQKANKNIGNQLTNNVWYSTIFFKFKLKMYSFLLGRSLPMISNIILHLKRMYWLYWIVPVVTRFTFNSGE